jgi:hypothetical protein
VRRTERFHIFAFILGASFLKRAQGRGGPRMARPGARWVVRRLSLQLVTRANNLIATTLESWILIGGVP